MKVLIVGNGRAGKRHTKIVQSYDMETVTVDPFANADYKTTDEALTKHDFDYIVVATPPDLHLEQLRELQGVAPILCEKPLCGLGQVQSVGGLANRSDIMVAYNYEYHSRLAKWQGKPINSHAPRGWGIHSENYRPNTPTWGLLLDHCSHAIDTMRWMSGGIKELQYAYHINGETSELWTLFGETETGNFSISERLWKDDMPRVAYMECQYGRIEIDADPVMFDNMWEAFLLGRYRPTVADAIKVQEIMDQAADMGDRREKPEYAELVEKLAERFAG